MELAVGKICAVCGAENGRFRYGAISCGACALFFRRLVNSKKIEKTCKCAQKGTTYICRLCRMNKCIEAGMNVCMVKTPTVNRRKIKSRSRSTLPIVKVNDGIIERSSDRLKSVQIQYDSFNSQRTLFKEIQKNSATMTLHDWSCLIVEDFDLMKQSFQNMHTELRALSHFEKDAIFTNFFTGFNLFEVAALPDRITSCFEGLGKASIDRYFYRSNETYNLTEKDLMRIFTPYWEYFYNNFKKAVLSLKLDEFEIGFVLSLRLLDSGFSKISEKTMEMCRSLRKVILRQLRSYYIEEGIKEKRLYDVLEISEHIEKVDSKFYQKHLLCETYGIKMDEGYRRIQNVAKL